MSWVADRQTTIYSRADAILTSKLGAKYADLNITMDSAKIQNAKFPSIYITFIGAKEQGQTLDARTINAVNMTVEVHVKTSKSQTQPMVENDQIAWEVVDAFKTMGFSVTTPNIPVSNIDGVYESVSRFSRIVAQGDII